MPRTPEANRRVRQATQNKIQSAALRMFTQKGYHATSIEDVARQAKVSKGLLYNYYKGKEDLLAAMVQERIDEMTKVMESAAAYGTPYEQLCQIVHGALDYVRQHPDEYRFYLNLQTQPKDDRVLSAYSQQLNEAAQKQFEVQCEIFAQLGVQDPRMRSLSFSSALNGAMMMIVTYPSGFPVDQMKEQMIREYGGVRNL